MSRPEELPEGTMGRVESAVRRHHIVSLVGRPNVVVEQVVKPIAEILRRPVTQIEIDWEQAAGYPSPFWTRVSEAAGEGLAVLTHEGELPEKSQQILLMRKLRAFYEMNNLKNAVIVVSESERMKHGHDEMGRVANFDLRVPTD